MDEEVRLRMTEDDARLIYWVCCRESENPFWFKDKAYYDKIQHERNKIAVKYNEAKQTGMDFTTSDELAVISWLMENFGEKV